MQGEGAVASAELPHIARSHHPRSWGPLAVLERAWIWSLKVAKGLVAARVQEHAGSHCQGEAWFASPSSWI